MVERMLRFSREIGFRYSRSVSPEPPIAAGKSFSEKLMVERTLRFS
jgi:hypothetical protein